MELTVFASVGTQLVVSIFIGFGMGYWLDKWLGTQPVLMLVFMLLGVAAGFLNIYRTVARGTKSGNGPDNNR
ncbi:MAG: AtpZ/AtpI family protein [Nitrospinae bacterium]|nr:AtpZ/AtpI family protein [Nitrospinota bacterium]